MRPSMSLSADSHNLTFVSHCADVSYILWFFGILFKANKLSKLSLIFSGSMRLLCLWLIETLLFLLRKTQRRCNQNLCKFVLVFITIVSTKVFLNAKLWNKYNINTNDTVFKLNIFAAVTPSYVVNYTKTQCDCSGLAENSFKVAETRR